MHVIVGMWGILRSLSFTLESINEFCLQPLQRQGFTFEIFIHTYNMSGDYHNLRNHEESTTLNISLWKNLNPDYIFIEDQDIFDRRVNYGSYEEKGDAWNNQYSSMKNHIRALNSLYHLTQAIETASKLRRVDAVIFLRPDVTYISELPAYLLPLFPNNTLFLPDFHRSCDGYEYNDRMAMGDVKSAITYGKRFLAALDYSKSNKLHSEKFTYAYLTAKRISVIEIPFRFRRTRSNGRIAERDVGIVSPSEENELTLHGNTPTPIPW